MHHATCIPICQAHRLLDPDPVVRRMAEIVVTAMGAGESRYLSWAAAHAAPALAARIDELAAAPERRRPSRPSDLDCEGVPERLGSGDTVTAVMAAQVLTVRALVRGTRLPGTRAERVARLLDVGRTLHLRRAGLWAHDGQRPPSDRPRPRPRRRKPGESPRNCRCPGAQ